MTETVRVDRRGSALLVVDVQRDFLPGGSLAVPDGDRILRPLAALMMADLFAVQVATQDWHPPDHVSFATTHPGRRPGDAIDLHGHPQQLWPDHCIQGSPGAALYSDLPWERASAIVRKGTEAGLDSYSAFRNNWNAEGRRPPTGLAGYLRELGVTSVFVSGLARDVCVRWTAEDAVQAGFETLVVRDLTRSVDPSGDAELEEVLASRGVRFVDAQALS